MKLRSVLACALLFLAVSALAHAAGKQSAEQTATINAVRDYVRSYTKSLPDYTAVLTVRHTARPPNAVNDPAIQTNVVEEHLSAIDGKENIAPSPGTQAHDFGNILGAIFDSATRADLRWDRASTLEHRKVDILAFHVPAATGYFLTANGAGVQVPFEGLIYADAETHAVIRLQMKCSMIPDESVIRAFNLTLDYKPAQLGGREFILPAHFILQTLNSAQDRQIYDDARYSDWRLLSPAGTVGSPSSETR